MVGLDDAQKDKLGLGFAVLDKHGLHLALISQLVKLVHKDRPKVYELRSGNIRVLFGIHNGVYWLLDGFRKKSRQTPPNRLKKAVGRIQSII
ncbi:MAG: hypothetical protein UY92_C0002G0037 [Candidatus Magasanikbacteria bacterium GW2011_GWA2_56_11]|uniref:Uncharacterized protein n=1 Tax=Candidatus Magasanikbacteria bacterium GW2011_GWA2_56_11 TaxID=1619044 RepID=A0A0G1YI69_9BACT|nr:MAG: hypothetical protein UY92_C0002G0037 [Candidatus Magasanikbacteria bacterium GW2011_GWA2_56_11]